jgi:uncharacterized membrane protein YkgB
MMRLLRSALLLEFGFVLIVVPWSSYWDRNYFAEVVPHLRAFLINNFVRGAVTGLGVINIIAGIAELVSIYSARAAAPTLTIHSSRVSEE